MNIFEEEIAKYERRLARIESNPSPLMIKSNKLFYQAQLQENKDLLNAWHKGKTFLGVGAQLTTLMRCFGDFEILNLVRIADRLGMKRAETSGDRVRAMGLPDYACDRTILFMPLAIMGDELPKPEIIVAATGACEVITDTHRALGRLLDVPTYYVDVPFEDPPQQHLPYVVDQLKRLVAWVEDTLPGAKFDEQKLARRQELARRWSNALHDVYRLRQHVPCPDHPRDVFREPMRPGQFDDASLMVKYYESYRDELKERVARNWTPVGEEKLRIVWSITGPYGSNIWDYLAERGVSVAHWHYGGADRIFAMPIYGDTAEFGRKLSPLEEEARMMLYNSWAGDGNRWIRDTVTACREFKADGLVQFEQTGCQPVQGLGQLVADAVERELGIPSWRIEGRQLLGRTERIENEFMTGLDAFINLCFERKKGRKAA